MAGALDGGVQDTLQAQLVSLERGDGLLEQLLGALVSGVDTADIDLFPLNGHILGLEDGLHGFRNLSTDTVTYSPKFFVNGFRLEFYAQNGRAIGGAAWWHIVPGMRVTVYFPPYLVGLKMSSDWSVAIAASDIKVSDHEMSSA